MSTDAVRTPAVCRRWLTFHIKLDLPIWRDVRMLQYSPRESRSWTRSSSGRFT